MAVMTTAFTRCNAGSAGQQCRHQLQVMERCVTVQRDTSTASASSVEQKSKRKIPSTSLLPRCILHSRTKNEKEIV